MLHGNGDRCTRLKVKHKYAGGAEICSQAGNRFSVKISHIIEEEQKTALYLLALYFDRKF